MTEAQTTAASPDLEELIALARRFADRKLYDEALELFQLALRLDPKNLGIRLALARLRKLQKLQTRRRRGQGPGRGRPATRSAATRSTPRTSSAWPGSTPRRGRSSAPSSASRSRAPRTPSRRPTTSWRGASTTGSRTTTPPPSICAGRCASIPSTAKAPSCSARSSTSASSSPTRWRRPSTPSCCCPRPTRSGRSGCAAGSAPCATCSAGRASQVVALFREREEALHIAFDRLEWRRERFRGAEALAEIVAAARRVELGGPPLDLGAAAQGRRLEPPDRRAGLQALGGGRRGEPRAGHAGLRQQLARACDLYWLEEGEISIQRPTPYGTFPLALLKPGSLFGEVNFISRGVRSGDAAALKPTRLLRFDGARLAELAENWAEFGVQLYWGLWHALAGKLRATNEQLKSFFAAGEQPENFLRLRRGRGAVRRRRRGRARRQAARSSRSRGCRARSSPRSPPSRASCASTRAARCSRRATRATRCTWCSRAGC